MNVRFLFLVILLALSTQAHSEGPSLREVFMDKESGQHLGMIDLGARQGMVAGTLLRTTRSVPNIEYKSQDVPTGLVKVIRAYEDHSLVAIVEDGNEYVKQIFKKYPGIMAGDKLNPYAPSIAQNSTVSPEATLSFYTVFLDPNSRPHSFELSSAGREQLQAMAAVFAEQRLNTLLVEAHTDEDGSMQANQTESMERAKVVRQFLVDELGFDPNRTIAIGLGENEIKDRSNTPSARQTNRRIVLKIIQN